MRLSTVREKFIAAKRDQRIAPSTLRTYDDQIRLFIGWVTVGHRDACEVMTARVVLDYLAAKERSVAPGSLHLAGTILKLFALWGAGERFWPYEAIRAIKAPPRPRRLPRPYRPTERDAFMALELDATQSLLRALLYYAGLRNAEIRGLRLRDVTPPHELPNGEVIPGRLYVFGKGSKERVVEMHPALWAAFQTYFKESLTTDTRPTRTVLVRKDGGMWNQRTVQRQVRAWALGIGVEGAKPHKFRHTFASDLLDDPSVKLTTIQALLGHSSPTTTVLYAQAKDRQRADAVAGLPTFLKSSANEPPARDAATHKVELSANPASPRTESAPSP